MFFASMPYKKIINYSEFHVTGHRSWMQSSCPNCQTGIFKLSQTPIRGERE